MVLLSSVQIRQSLDNAFSLRRHPVGLKTNGAGPEESNLSGCGNSDPCCRYRDGCCAVSVCSVLGVGTLPGLWNTFFLTLTRTLWRRSLHFIGNKTEARRVK